MTKTLDVYKRQGYARVKLMDNIHWGVMDTLGKIAIYPNLDYILPLESFKISHLLQKIEPKIA